MNEDLRLTRRSHFLATRADQIAINTKAIRGGKEYIEARLFRHACESDVSWLGSAASKHATGSVGRKDRACYTNYAGRIAAKLNQLVSSGGVTRTGCEDQFFKNATGTGVSLDNFMDRVGEKLTAAGWCWIGVDRMAAQLDEEGRPKKKSQLEKEKSGDRVWWSVWGAEDVVDWRFSEAGTLLWLITSQVTVETGGPADASRAFNVRSIYEPGLCTRLKREIGKEDAEIQTQTIPLTFTDIPFVLVGVPSADPWWFDDVERICCSLMNMQSCHDENLYQAGFPQLVIPSGLIRETMTDAGVQYDEAVSMIRGLNAPLMEPDASNGVSRYIQPEASATQALPTEMDRKRRELYETVGLALKRASGQVESAEAKRIDNLDISALIRQRAGIMSAAESAAVALSKMLDPQFKTWAPVYPKEFDDRNSSDTIKAVLEINSGTIPDVARREVARTLVVELARIGKIPNDKLQEMSAAVDEMDFSLDASLHQITDADSAVTNPEDGSAAGAQGADAPEVPAGLPPVEAFNGAQVSSLVEIVTATTEGRIPESSARGIARAAFPAIGPDMLAEIFGGLANFKPREPEQPAAPAPAAG